MPLLCKIESVMIVLCLDDTSPVTREDVSWSAWVGNGRNRWSITIRAGYLHSKNTKMLTCTTEIVYENGRTGPTLRMNEFVLGSLALRKAAPMSVSTGMKQFLLVHSLLT
jgi:carnitine O-acetyltransferase